MTEAKKKPNPYRSVRCTHCGSWCKANDKRCGMCGMPPLHAVGQGPR
jgi:hypothetical protein